MKHFILFFVERKKKNVRHKTYFNIRRFTKHKMTYISEETKADEKRCRFTLFQFLQEESAVELVYFFNITENDVSLSS